MLDSEQKGKENIAEVTAAKNGNVKKRLFGGSSGGAETAHNHRWWTLVS